MDGAAHELAARAHCQLSMVLRSRRFYSIGELVRLYWTFVLSIIDVGVAAYSHAPSFHLLAVDRVQERFLEELGISERTLYRKIKEFNL